jgi:hypothetical protein
MVLFIPSSNLTPTPTRMLLWLYHPRVHVLHSLLFFWDCLHIPPVLLVSYFVSVLSNPTPSLPPSLSLSLSLAPELFWKVKTLVLLRWLLGFQRKRGYQIYYNEVLFTPKKEKKERLEGGVRSMIMRKL